MTEAIEYLQRCEFLREVGPAVLALIAEPARELRTEPGALLFRRGEPREARMLQHRVLGGSVVLAVDLPLGV